MQVQVQRAVRQLLTGAGQHPPQLGVRGVRLPVLLREVRGTLPTKNLIIIYLFLFLFSKNLKCSVDSWHEAFRCMPQSSAHSLPISISKALDWSSPLATSLGEWRSIPPGTPTMATHPPTRAKAPSHRRALLKHVQKSSGFALREEYRNHLNDSQPRFNVRSQPSAISHPDETIAEGLQHALRERCR